MTALLQLQTMLTKRRNWNRLECFIVICKWSGDGGGGRGRERTIKIWTVHPSTLAHKSQHTDLCPDNGDREQTPGLEISRHTSGHLHQSGHPKPWVGSAPGTLGFDRVTATLLSFQVVLYTELYHASVCDVELHHEASHFAC